MKDLEQLYETVKKRNPNDKEFLQAVEEVFESLNIIADVHPEELDDDVLERTLSSRESQSRIVRSCSEYHG